MSLKIKHDKMQGLSCILSLFCNKFNKLINTCAGMLNFIYHMMRNARFGPLTLLMTLRVIDVKSNDKFTQLIYVSVLDANIRF